MNEDMASILSVLSDMERFEPSGDRLSEIVGGSEGEELCADELEQVSAARVQPSYSEFLKRLAEKQREI